MSKNKYKKFKQGIFKPINVSKCLNTSNVEYRSQLEFRLLRICDNNDAVISWSSESVIVPYMNPIKGKVCRYYIDAYIKLQTPNGPKEFLIEVKPYRQTLKPTPSKRQKETTIIYEAATYAINQAKWDAARQFANSKNMEFMIMTEEDISKLEGIIHPKRPS